MRDYLTMKTSQIPKIDRVYESFKTLAQSSGFDEAELVADIYKHSKNWVKLAFDRADEPELREAIADLNQLKVYVAYPFLLEVMDDHDQGTISDADLVAVIRLVESYVFRRALAGTPTNILNKTFAALAREIDKDNYIESLRQPSCSKSPTRACRPTKRCGARSWSRTSTTSAAATTCSASSRTATARSKSTSSATRSNTSCRRTRTCHRSGRRSSGWTGRRCRRSTCTRSET